MKKLLFISALFILCSVCKAQTQYIYNAYNKGAYILLVDSTHKDSFAYPKNTLIASLNVGARPQLTLSSVYSVSQGYGTGYAMVVATWDNSNIYILAPTVDSGFNKLNNMIFNDTFVLANYMKYADTLLPNPTIASYKQLLSSTFWTSSSGNLYPKNLSLNVGVGTATPQGILDVQASPSGFFRMTSDGVLHYNYNDEFFQLDGNNRRFQIGDLTYDWYGTSIDINDNAANQSINLRANNGVTINNLAGNGSGVAAVDNTGLLSWQNPYALIDTGTIIPTFADTNLTLASQHYVNVHSITGTSILDSTYAGFAHQTLAANTFYTITGASTITADTLTFPSGVNGNWIAVTFNKAVTTVSFGTGSIGTGQCGFIAATAGQTKWFTYLNGFWR